MAEPNLSPAATLIRICCLELGLSKARLVQLAGYKNEVKGIRRLDSLIAGDLETTRRLIQGLPAALNLPTDVISGVVDQTRQQIASMKRREAEQAGTEWRDNFQPHAVILTERTRPEPIFVVALIGAERLLCVDFDLDGEGESYVKKIAGRGRTQASEMERNDSCFRATYWIDCELCAQLCRSL